ncbi:MAG: hypothetical protein ACREMY_18040, partial [bacterium]
VDSVKVAVEALRADLDGAKDTLSKAERKCNAAAASIIVEEAKALATRLRTAQQQVWNLTNSLRGMGRLWVPESDGTIKPISLGREVLNSLDRQEPAVAPPYNPEVLSATKWRAYHANLQNNADLEFEEGSSERTPSAA